MDLQDNVEPPALKTTKPPKHKTQPNKTQPNPHPPNKQSVSSEGLGWGEESAWLRGSGDSAKGTVSPGCSCSPRRPQMTPSTLPSSHMPACPSPGHFLSTPIPSLYSTHTESCLSSFPRALIYTSPASCRALPEASPAFSVTMKYLFLRDLGIFSYFTHFHILHLADSTLFPHRHCFRALCLSIHATPSA